MALRPGGLDPVVFIVLGALAILMALVLDTRLVDLKGKQKSYLTAAHGRRVLFLDRTTVGGDAVAAGQDGGERALLRARRRRARRLARGRPGAPALRSQSAEEEGRRLALVPQGSHDAARLVATRRRARSAPRFACARRGPLPRVAELRSQSARFRGVRPVQRARLLAALVASDRERAAFGARRRRRRDAADERLCARSSAAAARARRRPELHAVLTGHFAWVGGSAMRALNAEAERMMLGNLEAAPARGAATPSVAPRRLRAARSAT